MLSLLSQEHVLLLESSSKCPMEIYQLYHEKHQKEDDLNLPVKNSLAHTVSAILAKLKLCVHRRVSLHPAHARICGKKLCDDPCEPSARRFFSFPVFFIYWLFSENASKKPLRSPQRLSGPIGESLEALKVFATSWMLLPPSLSAPS